MAYFNNGAPFVQPNNMYQNNAFMQGQGMQFNPGFQQHRLHNVLSADEIAELMKTNNQFSLALTEKDKKRAVCNHQKADGTGDSLMEDVNDGKVVCSICGYKFKPLDAYQTTKESLQAACDDILDVLQTIKLIWFDIDGTVAREYFQIIPLIEKIPELFEIAAKNYVKHENAMPWSQNTRNMSTMQAFAMLSSMLNGGTANYQQYQQQPNPAAMGWGYAQQPNPAMYQQPAGNINPTNGFGYVGAGPAGYQAQTYGFQTVYGQQPDPNQQAQQFQQVPPQFAPQGAPQPAPAPVNTQQAAPEAATATTDGATKTVAASFKA